MHSLPVAPRLLLLAALVTPGAAAQTITELPDSPVTPSGRLRIRGSNLGSGGSVTVNGVPALTTTWRSDEVHAYVPESTVPGAIQVQLTTATGQASNVATATVVPRLPDGQLNWRFAVSSVRPNGHGPAVGPDGTIYVDDSSGRLYAVEPDGALKWIFDGNAGTTGGGLEGPIVVAADGTIFYATNPLGPDIRVHAVRPDGTSRWMFTETSLAYRIIAGPGIGPDGNLYLVFDRAHLGTLGACSLDPSGNLRWSNPGTPYVNDTGSLGAQIAFGPDAFYVSFNEGDVPGVNDNHLFGFGYDGTQRFTVPGSWQNGRPHERSDGSFVLRWGLDSSVRSFDASGNEQWTFSAAANLAEPVIGPDGVMYHHVGSGGPTLHAIGTDGTIQWTVNGAHLGWMNFMGVSPQGGHLLDGGRAGFGQPGWIRSYSTVDGGLRWSHDLPEEDPGSGLADLVVQSEWAFDAGGGTGYAMVNALVWDVSDGYGYLYSMALDDPNIGASSCGPAVPNSSGSPGRIAARGSAEVSENDVTLIASDLPANRFGIFLASRTPGFLAHPGGSEGHLCLGGAIGRYSAPGQIQHSGDAGRIGLAIDLDRVPGPSSLVQVNAGDVWYFQAWHRDLTGGASTSNFTDAVAVTFH